MARFDWSDAIIAQLRAWWAEKVPAAEIGRRLGLTKSAIIGKSHRLGLPSREALTGKGMAGQKHTPAAIARMRVVQSGKTLTPAHREKLVAAGRRRYEDVWPPEIVAKAHAMWDAGDRIQDIADMAGRNYTTTASFIQGRGWPKRVRLYAPRTPEQIAACAVSAKRRQGTFKARHKEAIEAERAAAKARATAEFRARADAPKPVPAPLPSTADVNEWIRTRGVTVCPPAYAAYSAAIIPPEARAIHAARAAVEQTAKRDRHYQSCVRGAARSAARHG